LGVLDPAGGAGVLPLHPDGADALLQIAGLIAVVSALGVFGGRGVAIPSRLMGWVAGVVALS